MKLSEYLKKRAKDDAETEQAKKDAQAELETVVTELEAEVKTDEQ